MEATGRIVGWLAILGVVYVALKGSLPTYLAHLGI